MKHFGHVDRSRRKFEIPVIQAEGANLTSTQLWSDMIKDIIGLTLYQCMQRATGP